MVNTIDNFCCNWFENKLENVIESKVLPFLKANIDLIVQTKQETNSIIVKTELDLSTSSIDTNKSAPNLELVPKATSCKSQKTKQVQSIKHTIQLANQIEVCLTFFVI